MNEEELKKEFNLILDTYKPKSSGIRREFEYAKQHEDKFIRFALDTLKEFGLDKPSSPHAWKGLVGIFWVFEHKSLKKMGWR